LKRANRALALDGDGFELLGIIDNKGLKILFSGGNPALGSFSNRMAAAFALGLISEREYKMADTLRQIRNEFAHRIVVRYTDEKISRLIINPVQAARRNDRSPRLKKVEEDLA
jgi:DNA-binding MltR family transcriptional regulator